VGLNARGFEIEFKLIMQPLKYFKKDGFWGGHMKNPKIVIFLKDLSPPSKLELKIFPMTRFPEPNFCRFC